MYCKSFTPARFSDLSISCFSLTVRTPQCAHTVWGKNTIRTIPYRAPKRPHIQPPPKATVLEPPWHPSTPGRSETVGAGIGRSSALEASIRSSRNGSRCRNRAADTGGGCFGCVVWRLVGAAKHQELHQKAGRCWERRSQGYELQQSTDRRDFMNCCSSCCHFFDTHQDMLPNFFGQGT